MKCSEKPVATALIEAWIYDTGATDKTVIGRADVTGELVFSEGKAYHIRSWRPIVADETPSNRR